MSIFELKTIIIVLAILAGVFLIFLGYRLYAIGIKELGDTEISHGDSSLKLKRFGPGVVLALFGAALIVFGITRTFTSQSSSKVTRVLPDGQTLSVEENSYENAVFQIETSNMETASDTAEESATDTESDSSQDAPHRNP